MDISTAIIQFIGIALFSAAIPEDPGVKAIVPRIGDSDDGTAISFIDGVEKHKAVILFRQEDRLHNVGGWRADATLPSGWQYVELDGEYVQFITDRRDAEPADPPVDLPGLARLSCRNFFNPPTLAAEFLPKTSYKGAAGVFDIPEGRLDACLMGAGGRADTRLFLDTRNVLIITAKKPGETAKTISLDADAVVYVANVPPSYLTDDPEEVHDHEPHWDAYNDMLGRTCADPPYPDKPFLAECYDPNRPLTAAYEEARANPPTMGLGHILDPQCSNSQWP